MAHLCHGVNDDCMARRRSQGVCAESKDAGAGCCCVAFSSRTNAFSSEGRRHVLVADSDHTHSLTRRGVSSAVADTIVSAGTRSAVQQRQPTLSQ